jgi:hypothetical protein
MKTTIDRRAAIGSALVGALASMLLVAQPARAQLSGATTSGSTCTGPGNNDDGSTTCAVAIQTNTGTNLATRFEFTVSADLGVGSTRDQNGNGTHQLNFNATAVGGYRLVIGTTRVGEMARSSDIAGCDGAADVSGVAGNSNIAINGGGVLGIGDPGAIGNGGGDTSLPFTQSSGTATIFRQSNGAAQAHTLTFTQSANVRSNSCEAGVRIGSNAGTTTGCAVCDYPGNPSRTQATDGHFVTVTYTSLCGNGVVDALAGEQCDLGAGNNGLSTTCCTSQCLRRAAGQICRAGQPNPVGGTSCDLTETCTGASGSCPADDAPGNLGNTCRVGSGDACDPDEVCNGVPGVACPADVRQPNGALCRSGSGDLCDPNEACTGVAGAACPANVVNGPSTVCRVGSGDACDTNETCTGVAGAACPNDDAPINGGVVCRAGSGDVCDLNETCTGTPGAACPADDAPANLGSVCRPSSAMGSFCDMDELCGGIPGVPCPPNDAPGNVNVLCRAGSGDACDPDERCTGITGQGCPADIVAPPTTVCRAGSGDLCDPSEFCTAIPGAACPGDAVASGGTICRAATGVCDIAEQCSGTALAPCPSDAFAPAAAPCDTDNDVCTLDVCNGAGGCVFDAPLNCEDGNACTQDSCDSVTGCMSTGVPATTCTAGVKASLAVSDKPVDSADSVKFKWKGGPVTGPALGDPTNSTRFELCIYDATGVRRALGVPPVTNWRTIGLISSPKGYLYKDSTLTNAGVKKMKLLLSPIDRAKLELGAKGENVPDSVLPFVLPVRAQLYSSTGQCWDAEFQAANTKRNDVQSFKAKRP